MKMIRIGLAWLALCGAAYGQAQVPAGGVMGNPTAAQRPAQAATVTAILDRALGSTRGAILERGAAGWQSVAPSATVGLPWISQGAGADPVYGVLPLAGGGCNAALTASLGGILYSTATACAVLPGTATARQMLQSGASAAPAWSTTTWPATTTINRILYSSSANVIGEITTGNNGVLVTSGGGVPSISSTLPSGIAATSMALTTPAIGVATGTSLALNGCTIGANALCATGTANISGTMTVGTLAATTINAFTLAGAIAGGGNQLNNIVIGTTTPLAGSFTTVGGTTITASTSVVTPIINAGSALTFQTNSGNFAGTINTSQQWLISGTSNTIPTGPLLTISKNTAALPAVGTPGGIAGTAQLGLIVGGSDAAATDIVVQSFGNFAAGIRYMSSAGTAASRTATTGAGGTIGANFAYTYTGSVYVASSGFILSNTEATVSGSASGGRVDFYGTPTGTTGIVLAASAGAGLMIGTTSDPGAGHLRATGYLQTSTGVAVASLPACSATTRGARHMVTDANAAMTAGIGAVVAAGGANIVPVVCDGTNWRIG